MATTLEELEGLFDDHPSLDASLQDFEGNGSSELLHRRSPSSNLGHGGMYPSHHSGFRSEGEESESDVAESASGYSPPAWRRTGKGTRSSDFWNRRDNALGRRSRTRSSRGSSPEYESADDGADAALAAAARTRLPTGSLSPEKGRSLSPDPFPHGGGDFAPAFGGGGQPAVKPEFGKPLVPMSPTPENPNSNNYIRFAVRAEVQHRTEPFEKAFQYVTEKLERMTSSWTSLISSLVVIFLSSLALRSIFQPGAPLPVPDLVKVAGLAKAFEPLIFYSENGVQQVSDLQATGVAVWDLGESVRSSNMTSAPIIVQELDDLSESLKTLAIELTRFFANVDGDVDGILIVMDWAKRELSALPNMPPTPLSSAWHNIHGFLTLMTPTRLLASLLPSSTSPSASSSANSLTTSLLGTTTPQRTRATLQRTFNELLSVLEEAIQTELASSVALFAIFESIDRQFLNLARTVIRESDQQDRLESDLLASLWTRILGPNSANLRKFEKNRQLLLNVREKTVRNKHVLVDHNGKLLALKANLEMLRKKLVSPLVRSGNSSTISVDEQIRGLQGTYDHLKLVRERQKGRLMEALYGRGSGHRQEVVGGREGLEIEGSR